MPLLRSSSAYTDRAANYHADSEGVLPTRVLNDTVSSMRQVIKYRKAGRSVLKKITESGEATKKWIIVVVNAATYVKRSIRCWHA